MNSKQIKIGVAIGTIALGAVLGAQANTISQQQTLNPTTTDWNHTFVFDQFDSHLGSLNQVLVHYSEDFFLSSSSKNNSAGNMSVTIDEDALLTLTMPAGVSQASATLDPSLHQHFLVAPNSTAVTPSSASVSGDFSFTSAADLAYFLGAGTLNFAGSTLVSETVSYSGGNNQVGLTTTAGAGVRLTYDYTPTVPETAAPVWFSALAGLGFLAIASRIRPLKPTRQTVR